MSAGKSREGQINLSSKPVWTTPCVRAMFLEDTTAKPTILMSKSKFSLRILCLLNRHVKRYMKRSAMQRKGPSLPLAIFLRIAICTVANSVPMLGNVSRRRSSMTLNGHDEMVRSGLM